MSRLCLSLRKGACSFANGIRSFPSAPALVVLHKSHDNLCFRAARCSGMAIDVIGGGNVGHPNFSVNLHSSSEKHPIAPAAQALYAWSKSHVEEVQAPASIRFALITRSEDCHISCQSFSCLLLSSQNSEKRMSPHHFSTCRTATG